jgi:small subunit ribosomal protein S2
VPLLHQALVFVRDVVSGGGRVLFVGTKRQASEAIAESAKRCGQYYVNHRWLGGMLTNWKTISKSIKRLRDVEDQLGEGETGFTKKELLKLTRERDKLDRALGGIKEMGGLPDVLFVIDTNKEHIAIDEAKVLNIPVIAVLDSNSDPDKVAHPVPGNDDAIRAIALYCELISGAVLDGIQAELAASGGDAGAAPDGPVEVLPEAPAETPEAPAPEAPATEVSATEASATEAPASEAAAEKPAVAETPAEPATKPAAEPASEPAAANIEGAAKPAE